MLSPSSHSARQREVKAHRSLRPVPPPIPNRRTEGRTRSPPPHAGSAAKSRHPDGRAHARSLGRQRLRHSPRARVARCHGGPPVLPPSPARLAHAWRSRKVQAQKASLAHGVPVPGATSPARTPGACVGGGIGAPGGPWAAPQRCHKSLGDVAAGEGIGERADGAASMPGWQAQPQPPDGVPSVALQVPLRPPRPYRWLHDPFNPC